MEDKIIIIGCNGHLASIVRHLNEVDVPVLTVPNSLPDEDIVNLISKDIEKPILPHKGDYILQDNGFWKENPPTRPRKQKIPRNKRKGYQR